MDRKTRVTRMAGEIRMTCVAWVTSVTRNELSGVTRITKMTKMIGVTRLIMVTRMSRMTVVTRLNRVTWMTRVTWVTTGSPSALCVGSGFKGHLVGIY